MDTEEDLGLCGCGRKVNKRGKTCCSMCWHGHAGHSRRCRQRMGLNGRSKPTMVPCEPGSEIARKLHHFVTHRTGRTNGDS